MADLLAIDALRAGYGEAVVLPNMSLTLPEGQVLIVGSHSLPVDTHTSLPFDDAATLDQTLPPIDPAGTVCQVFSTCPVCWSSSTTPPRISGLSQADDKPT